MNFCYFFLVPPLHFDPLVLCNLITEFFFRSADHYNNNGTGLSLHYQLFFVMEEELKSFSKLTFLN